jgi:hypothetical protein
MTTAPISAQPISTASRTGVVPVNAPEALPGAAATAVAVSSTCVSVGVGVGMFPGDAFDFPQVPVTSMRTGLLAHSDRRRQAVARQIDGVS